MLEPRKAIAARKELEFRSLYGVAVTDGFLFAFFTFFVLFVYGRAILAFQFCVPRTSQTDGKRLTPSCHWRNCGILFAPYSLV